MTDYEILSVVLTIALLIVAILNLVKKANINRPSRPKSERFKPTY